MNPAGERRYLASCSRDGAGVRQSTAVRVATLVRMHQAGEDTPISGDATLVWVGQR